MSHFGAIGHHLIVAIIDHIPNGWVMWTWGHLMTHVITYSNKPMRYTAPIETQPHGASLLTARHEVPRRCPWAQFLGHSMSYCFLWTSRMCISIHICIYIYTHNYIYININIYGIYNLSDFWLAELVYTCVIMCMYIYICLHVWGRIILQSNILCLSSWARWIQHDSTHPPSNHGGLLWQMAHTPLEIMDWKSVGMIIPFPTEWQVIIHFMVPNHQPDFIIYIHDSTYDLPIQNGFCLP